MDLALFQISLGEAVDRETRSTSALGGGASGRANRHRDGEPAARRRNPTANSVNLDFLRAYAVILVVGFHLAKFFNWRFGKVRVTDFGLLGVMLFFVHTTLVLMFSFERQRASGNALLFAPFMIRRIFRIYPLAILVVVCAYLFRIPSDLYFGGFGLLHQSPPNLFANLLLIQNVTLQKANPGVLWSLPLELQMYVALPALFLFASRVKSPWGAIVLWWLAVALWYAVGCSTGMLPLSDGRIRSPIEALLKFTRFTPCFLPGIVAYKLWHAPRALPAWGWPIFLALCSVAFMWISGTQPIETGWFLCFAIGLGACGFREMQNSPLTWATQRVARYSYGIYLVHYFAIWLAFDASRRLNIGSRIAIFLGVLAGLSALLYQAVEAPLIAVGIRWSERMKNRTQSARPAARLAATATRATSCQAGSL